MMPRRIPTGAEERARGMEKHSMENSFQMIIIRAFYPDDA